MEETCDDNRFEIIDKAKAHLLEKTNIKDSEDEMKCIDSFLFRCWQMGWLEAYNDDKITKIEDGAKIELTNLYEINKKGFEARGLPYNDADFEVKLEEVADWFKDKTYCMLLCKERSDYTVFDFTKNDNPDYVKAAQYNLKACIKNRGRCLNIKYDNKLDAFEIWIKTAQEGVVMFYLFECGDFIIGINEKKGE